MFKKYFPQIFYRYFFILLGVNSLLAYQFLYRKPLLSDLEGGTGADYLSYLAIITVLLFILVFWWSRRLFLLGDQRKTKLFFNTGIFLLSWLWMISFVILLTTMVTGLGGGWLSLIIFGVAVVFSGFYLIFLLFNSLTVYILSRYIFKNTNLTVPTPIASLPPEEISELRFTRKLKLISWYYLLGGLFSLWLFVLFLIPELFDLDFSNRYQELHNQYGAFSYLAVIFPILSIAIFFGLRKLKRWAFYLVLFMSLFSIGSFLWSLIDGSTASNTNLSLHSSGWIIDIIIIVYLWPRFMKKPVIKS